MFRRIVPHVTQLQRRNSVHNKVRICDWNQSLCPRCRQRFQQITHRLSRFVIATSPRIEPQECSTWNIRGDCTFKFWTEPKELWLSDEGVEQQTEAAARFGRGKQFAFECSTWNIPARSFSVPNDPLW